MTRPFFNPTIPPMVFLMRMRERKHDQRTSLLVQAGHPARTNNLRPPNRSAPVPPKTHPKAPYILSAPTLVRKGYKVPRLPRDV